MKNLQHYRNLVLKISQKIKYLSRLDGQFRLIMNRVKVLKEFRYSQEELQEQQEKLY